MDNNKKRYRIAYLTSADPLNKNRWSGTHYYIAKALQKHTGDVFFLGPTYITIIFKIATRISKMFLGKIYYFDSSIFLARWYAWHFGRKIERGTYDFIFAPASTTEIALLDAPIPIIFSCDTTFRLLYNYYPEFGNIFRVSIKELDAINHLAIQKASLCVFSSDWAAKSAINDYNADKNRVFVIPFGANIDEDLIPSSDIVDKRRKSDACRLLFLGKNWQRKGGEIAFETLIELEKMGVRAELTICGCVPPHNFSHKNMKVIKFLDKNDLKQGRELANLLMSSDFLLLPTRSECYGIVFCEANAFGLPVITTDTGGVSTIIKNGENGFMLPITARGDEYARIIKELYEDDDRYYKLVRSSRQAYDERLNWDIWAKEVKRLIDEKLNIL